MILSGWTERQRKTERQQRDRDKDRETKKERLIETERRWTYTEEGRNEDTGSSGGIEMCSDLAETDGRVGSNTRDIIHLTMRRGRKGERDEQRSEREE